MLQDLRQAWRGLQSSPGFTLTAVLTLAIGIGLNAAVFTIVDAVLFKGFPLVRDNDRLVYITSADGCCVSYPDFEEWREQAKSFDGMAITHGIAAEVSDSSGFPERYDSTEVSAETFAVVGQRPILGRDFTAADQVPGARRVAILNYGLWARRYAKDPGVVGRTVRVNGSPTEIVGVMPSGFSFPQKVDLWVPLVKTAEVMDRTNRATWFVVGRLADGVAVEGARAEMIAIHQRQMREHPVETNATGMWVRTFREFFIGDDSTTLYRALWGAVAFVLLIACANLANLLLARGTGRAREVSVRFALGASRWRIIRQGLAESFVLAMLGGLVACGVASMWLGLYGLGPEGISSEIGGPWFDGVLDYSMDVRVFVYIAVVSVIATFLCGLIPAMSVSRLDVNAALKDGARGATGGGRNRRLASLLVAVEMALAVVLLAGAGMSLKSFRNAAVAKTGFDQDRLMGAIFSLPASRYPDANARGAFYRQMKERLGALPGVESVTMSGALPGYGAAVVPYETGEARADGARYSTVSEMNVAPNFFETVGARVIVGDRFENRTQSVVVDENFAKAQWPGENPIGKRVRFVRAGQPLPWFSVVGVVSNIAHNSNTADDGERTIYVLEDEPPVGAWMIVRTSGSPAVLMNDFRRESHAVDPDLATNLGPAPVSELLRDRHRYRAVNAGMFGVMSVVALFLAAFGLYAVVAHAVGQRTSEIGIRIAMGAGAGDIRRLVLAHEAAPLMGGLIAGLLGAFALGRVLQASFVHVSAADPLVLAGSAGALFVFAAIGCWVPVRRALRIDPMAALRHE